jgi:quinone-modifying oxidoreductase, subunit QmoA
LHPILVIGGGITGITAAVELAETGATVILVEKQPYLGGNVAGFNNYFPKFCPPVCGLEINFRRIRSSPRISYYTGAEVNTISGSAGSFIVEICIAPRLINNRCTSCGRCAEVCPVERPVKPGQQAGPRAVYVPGGLAFPMKYTIDPELCRGEVCGKCLEVCNYDAIQLDAKKALVSMQVSRIVVATGWRSYEAGRLRDYRYEQEPDVVTNLDFEHLLASCHAKHTELTRPSDGKRPESIAFVQCAGSRDVNHLPYCSSVCCSASLKHALTLAERSPGIRSEIFYIDLRVTGRNEKLLTKAEKEGSIRLTRGKVGRIERDELGLILEVEDILAGIRRTDRFDMVVLATGLVPNHIRPVLHTDEYGFYYLQQPEGIHPAGTVRRPMDVSASVKDATAAALRAIQK